MFKYLLVFVFIFSCTPKGVLETNQRKIYLSNEQVMYDLKEKSFKIEFSINNYTDTTLSNFEYELNFILMMGFSSSFIFLILFFNISIF